MDNVIKIATAVLVLLGGDVLINHGLKATVTSTLDTIPEDSNIQTNSQSSTYTQTDLARDIETLGKALDERNDIDLTPIIISYLKDEFNNKYEGCILNDNLRGIINSSIIRSIALENQRYREQSENSVKTESALNLAMLYTYQSLWKRKANPLADTQTELELAVPLLETLINLTGNQLSDLEYNTAIFCYKHWLLFTDPNERDEREKLLKKIRSRDKNYPENTSSYFPLLRVDFQGNHSKYYTELKDELNKAFNYYSGIHEGTISIELVPRDVAFYAVASTVIGTVIPIYGKISVKFIKKLHGEALKEFMKPKIDRLYNFIKERNSLIEFISRTLVYRYCKQINIIHDNSIKEVARVGTLLMVKYILDSNEEGKSLEDIANIFLRGLTHPNNIISGIFDVEKPNDAKNLRGVPIKTISHNYKKWNAQSLYRKPWIRTESGEIYAYTFGDKISSYPKYEFCYSFKPNEINKLYYKKKSKDDEELFSEYSLENEQTDDEATPLKPGSQEEQFQEKSRPWYLKWGKEIKNRFSHNN